ncbi:MAG: phage tail sheath subtilisin-like domain-containing protein [Candidatus Entotheonellia bacterium]
MAFNIGINVVETEGRAAPAIAGAPTSVAGLLLRSRRGPTDRAVRVSNFQQFVARFGGHDPRFVGAYCVEGFFLNGGREAHVGRVVASDSIAASVTLRDRNGNDTLTVTAGFRGMAEAGAWGNDLYVDIRDNPEFSTRLAATLGGNQPARLQGNALGASLDLSVPAGNPPRTLTLDVDDPATRLTITFDRTTLPVPAQASPLDVVDAINAQAGQRVVAIVEGGGILLISRAKGASSRITVVTGVDDDTRNRLGFPDGTTTASGAASANPSYTQVQVESLAGLQIGDWVRLDDGITQNWHRITDLVEHDDGAGNVQYVAHWDAPPAAEQNEYRIQDRATLATCEFDLGIRLRGPTDPAPQPVETWEKLAFDQTRSNDAPQRLNDPFSGSAYVLLTDLNPGTFNGRDVPAPGQGFRLGISTPATATLTRVQGTDGTDPATGDYRGALSRFDNIAIQLLAVPEVMPDGMLSAVMRSALDYCAGPNKGDCMLVGHTPPGRDVEGAKSFGQEFRAAKVYGALYWPWITVTDPAGGGPNPTRVIPPTGHVLGAYARIDQTRGVWKAPAGNEAILRGALMVERDVTDVDHTDLVKNGSVNGIRRFPGTGIVIDASRTLSTDTRWLYVNVRLLFDYVKASLRDGLRYVKQEPNRESLWNKIKYNTVTPFLLRLFQEGAFGPGRPEDVFTVVCGPENNPPEEIALGNLRVEIYFFPSRPAETIIIIVGQQESGATASER